MSRLLNQLVDHYLGYFVIKLTDALKQQVLLEKLYLVVGVW
jgi:hypothetical protein